jgi:hypothetical protein
MQCSSSAPPIAPEASAAFIRRYPASNRRMNPTCTGRRPDATSAACTVSASNAGGGEGLLAAPVSRP